MGASLRRLVAELHRRTGRKRRRRGGAPPRLADYLATLFPGQRALVDCWDEQVAVLGTRRAGKSKMVPAKLFAAAERYPGTVLYYLHPDGGTRARETLLGPDINLERIAEEYRLPWRFNQNLNTFFHKEDGTEIRLRGADDVREARKYRGDKVGFVLLEEAQNFPSSIIKALVEDILGPALADVGGSMMAIGTAGEVAAGYWYDVTRNENEESRSARLPGWRVLEWNVLDNPHMVQQAAGVIARKLLPYTDKPRDELVALLLSGHAGRALVEAIAAADPSVLREWFGRWVADSGALFYAFDARRNVYDGALPAGHVWWYVLGGDLGTGDAYAHHVWAVAHTCNTLFEVESYSEPGLHAGQWRERFAAAQKRWNTVASVVDEGGLGKGVAEEWRDVYHLPVEPADKVRKAAAVSSYNAELREGRVKLLACPVPEKGLAGGATAKEMAALRKARDSAPGKPPMEDPSQPNHASDASLYAFRRALELAGRQTVDTRPPAPGSPEATRQEEERRFQAALARVEAERAAESLDWL